MYVIELEVGAALGPRPDASLPYLYVGISKNKPKQRFEIHKAGGITANSKVRTFGKKLRPDLVRQYPAVLEPTAAALEQEVANELRKKGYVVDAGGYGLPYDRLRRQRSPRSDLP